MYIRAMPHVKVKSKRCRDCRKKKRISEFYVKERRQHSTRYFSRCKPCYYSFLRSPKTRAGRKIDTRRRLTDRQRADRKKAWAAVNNDVYRQRLEKPAVCSKCGKRTPSGDLHAHHHKGHRNRRDIIWMCGSCHAEAHAI